MESTCTNEANLGIKNSQIKILVQPQKKIGLVLFTLLVIWQSLHDCIFNNVLFGIKRCS